jgi:hypothetical protein
MIAKLTMMKMLRNTAFGLALPVMSGFSGAQAQTATTGVMVILTVKAGVAKEQVMAVMPSEVRETVQLYLQGKISEWFSRSDGRGVVFLLNTKDVAEAQAIMDSLPLGKANIVDYDYVSVGPLMPLGLLVDINAQPKQ